jgi:hypothetical protein
MPRIAITVGRALHVSGETGKVVHMVRTEDGKTACSFLLHVPVSNRRKGDRQNLTCKVCKGIAAVKIKRKDYLVPGEST